MRIAVTGGTGFIGYRLALIARSRGFDVVVSGRPGGGPAAEVARAQELRDTGVRVEAAPLTDRGALRELFKGRDLVVHLAAAQHEMNVPDQVFLDVNVEGVRAVIESAAAESVSRVVHASTIGVYGRGQPAVIDESSPTAPDNIYGRTKEAGEEVVRQASGSIAATIVRVGETYGPGDYRLVKLFAGVQSGRFPLIGGGSNLHQPIYVDDLVEVFFRCVSSDGAVGETLIAAGPAPITTRAMAEAAAAALGQPLRARRLPMAPLVGVACAMEWTLRPLGIQPPLHRRRLDFYRKNLAFDIGRMQTALGYRPETDFTTGARHTLAWYREKGLVE
ncbi:MAG: NAD(P)-dependent oxidoreductase [Planctomycetota bacterium]|nr:NAD(P)-dependent oxidoreductase [Planctomycetota bacterium]